MKCIFDNCIYLWNTLFCNDSVYNRRRPLLELAAAASLEMNSHLWEVFFLFKLLKLITCVLPARGYHFIWQFIEVGSFLFRQQPVTHLYDKSTSGTRIRILSPIRGFREIHKILSPLAIIFCPDEESNPVLNVDIEYIYFKKKNTDRPSRNLNNPIKI